MPAEARTHRDERRRRLGQNFICSEGARRLVDEADLRSGELVVEIGAGLGPITLELAKREIEVMAVELDPVWAERLRHLVRRVGHTCVEVVDGDFRSLRLPARPFRAMGSLPFDGTTEILRHLLDEPQISLTRADVIVQWEVARKRAATPPSTMLSTIWAPWWEFRLGRRIPAREFRPVPRVEAGVLIIRPRASPLLPPAMARSYGAFVRAHWPFHRGRV